MASQTPFNPTRVSPSPEDTQQQQPPSYQTVTANVNIQASRNRNPKVLQLPSIVPGPVIEPSRDPDTGLAIFPRLPEEDEDPCAVFQGSAPTTPTMEQQQQRQDTPSNHKRTLSGRIASLFRSSSVSSSRSNSSNRSTSRDSQQPVVRKEKRSGGHVYCKHTWDEKCKCKTILTLSEGDYCTKCWEGRCVGEVPYHQYPTPPSPSPSP